MDKKEVIRIHLEVVRGEKEDRLCWIVNDVAVKDDIDTLLKKYLSEGYAVSYANEKDHQYILSQSQPSQVGMSEKELSEEIYHQLLVYARYTTIDAGDACIVINPIAQAPKIAHALASRLPVMDRERLKTIILQSVKKTYDKEKKTIKLEIENLDALADAILEEGR